MKNNKGFTMIELLACVIIISILIGVSVAAVYKHINSSKQSAYENLEETIYDGARNYVLNNGTILNNCSLEYTKIDDSNTKLLLTNEFISNIIDPANKEKECTYEVYGCKEKDEMGITLSSYKYKVILKGSKYNKTYIHNDDGTKQEVK